MKRKSLAVTSVLFLVLLGSQPAWAAWLVRSVKEGTQVKIQSVIQTDREVRGERQVLRSIPYYLSEDLPPSKRVYEEVLYQDLALPERFRPFIRNGLERHALSIPGSEVRTLIEQGPVRNRINLTLVGDGYTGGEKEKFFADAKRIYGDLFSQTTYHSYLPLFNVYAVFVPSKQSGISDGDTSRDTALGLYRNPPHSKRGVMPGDDNAIEAAIALAPAADFPILIGNDDFYGGLGGRYAITTRSVESGTMVLRHELGHNFGQVGEEYDGGMVYTGANFSESSDVPWKPWIKAPLGVYESRFLSGSYLWQDLSQGPAQIQFDFPQATEKGDFSFEVLISSVGWETPEDVHAYLDGKQMAFSGIYTADRSFFTLNADRTLAPGPHTLEFRENVHDHDNVLAFAEVYAHGPDVDFTPGNVAAFSDFDQTSTEVGYRPTFDTCLMRNMRSTEFCPVDKENMWQRFLARVSLIDEVVVSDDSGSKKVTLKGPGLEGLSIHWFRVDHLGKETELSDAKDRRVWNAAASERGAFRVRVDYKTPEVRIYTDQFSAKKDFVIK